MSDYVVAETSTRQHTTLHNRQTSMLPVGLEPSTSADERPQTYALDRAATGTGAEIVNVLFFRGKIILIPSDFFFYWRYNPLWVCILQPSSGARASSRTRFLDHTQRRVTVGRTPLDE